MDSSLFKAIVIGGSTGGLSALRCLLSFLPSPPLPIIVVLHLHSSDLGRLAKHLNSSTPHSVSEAYDKEPLYAPHVFTAPANYHIYIESNQHLALSVDRRVNWARPSIDLLFESAARALQGQVIGVILSGANSDGAQGARAIFERGGLCFAQSPQSCESASMPQACIQYLGLQQEFILTPERLGGALAELTVARELH